jgi:glycerophosphoryl diester phosphodiesterase
MTTSVAANPWLERRAFHWAHQGGAKEAPSNTLHAMEHGCAAGADGLEFDVHRSRDGHVVVIHDASLHRTTDRSGWVPQHSAGELAGCDAAYWWVNGEVDNHELSTPESEYELRGRIDKDPDLGIPTLDALLERFGHMPMTIEVKSGQAAEPLIRNLQARNIPFDNLIVTSFSDAVVDELHRLAPDLPLAPAGGWTFRFYLRCRLHLPVPKRGPFVALQVPHRRPLNEIPQIPGFIRALLPKTLMLKVTSPRFVRVAHRAGLAVHVWTIDEADEMRTLIDMGVDGIMTDRPTVFAAVLGAGRNQPGGGAGPAKLNAAPRRAWRPMSPQQIGGPKGRSVVAHR